MGGSVLALGRARGGAGRQSISSPGAARRARWLLSPRRVSGWFVETSSVAPSRTQIASRSRAPIRRSRQDSGRWSRRDHGGHRRAEARTRDPNGRCELIGPIDRSVTDRSFSYRSIRQLRSPSYLRGVRSCVALTRKPLSRASRLHAQAALACEPSSRARRSHVRAVFTREPLSRASRNGACLVAHPGIGAHLLALVRAPARAASRTRSRCLVRGLALLEARTARPAKLSSRRPANRDLRSRSPRALPASSTHEEWDLCASSIRASITRTSPKPSTLAHTAHQDAYSRDPRHAIRAAGASSAIGRRMRRPPCERGQHVSDASTASGADRCMSVKRLPAVSWGGARRGQSPVHSVCARRNAAASLSSHVRIRCAPVPDLCAADDAASCTREVCDRAGEASGIPAPLV